MAYIPGFTHDIFVSYAHVDNQPLFGAEKGWVTTLVDNLRILLAEKLGRSDAYSLWMDPKLSGNAPLTPAILEALEGSANLLMILSPGYLSSEWCLREKETFLKRFQGQNQLMRQIFLVERLPVPVEQRPAELQDLLGYRFWANDADGRPRTLGVPKPNPHTEQRYFNLLDDLSRDLENELQRNQQARQRTASAIAITSNHQELAITTATVYLAEVTDDLDEPYEELKRYLEQAGLKILPNSYYPRDPDTFQQAVDADLSQCQLFVQLLSPLPGRKPRGFVRLQYERALALGKTLLQWRDPELFLDLVTDHEQRQLLNSDKVLATTLEEFKREVRKRALSKPPPVPLKPVTDSNALVFLHAETVDMELANNIGEALSRQGIWQALPPADGSPAEVREEIEQYLRECDGLILVYGQVGANWVRNQLVNYRKVWRDRERPLQSLAIYQGPPLVKNPLNFTIPNMQVLDGREGFDEARLRKFLAALQAGQAV